jgi:hypothetical protein
VRAASETAAILVAMDMERPLLNPYSNPWARARAGKGW